MYRNDEFLHAKIVPTGGSGWGGSWGGFSAYAEMRKEIHQVLDFQGFAFFRNLSAIFPHSFRKIDKL